MELPGAVAIEQVPDGGGDDDVQHLETPGDAPQYEHAHRSVTLTPIPSPRRSKVAMMSHTQSQSNLVTYIPGIAFISIALLTLYYIDVVAEVMMMVFVITSRGHVDNIQHWDSALVAGLKNTYNCSGTFHRDLDDHLIVDLDCQHSLAAMELLIEGASFASLLPPPPPRYIVRDPGHHVGCTSGIVDDRGQYMCHWMSTGASCVITMVDIFSDITFVSKQIDWCPGTVTQLHLRVMEAPYYEDMSYAHHQRLFVSAFVLLLIKEVLKLSIFLMMVVSKRMRRFSIISLFIHNMMTGVAFACSQTFVDYYLKFVERSNFGGFKRLVIDALIFDTVHLVLSIRLLAYGPTSDDKWTPVIVVITNSLMIIATLCELYRGVRRRRQRRQTAITVM